MGILRIISRCFSLTGLGLVCVSFYLPQVQACNSPVVPAEDVANNWSLLFGAFLPFALAMCLAPLGLLRLLIRRVGFQRVVSMLIMMWCLASLGWASAQFASLMIEEGWRVLKLPFGICIAVVWLALLACSVLMLRKPWQRRPGWALALTGLSATVYFGVHAGTHDALYGVYVSTAGAATWMLGGFLEVWAEAGQPLPPRDPQLLPQSSLT